MSLESLFQAPRSDEYCRFFNLSLSVKCVWPFKWWLHPSFFFTLLQVFITQRSTVPTPLEAFALSNFSLLSFFFFLGFFSPTCLYPRGASMLPTSFFHFFFCREYCLLTVLNFFYRKNPRKKKTPPFFRKNNSVFFFFILDFWVERLSAFCCVLFYFFTHSATSLKYFFSRSRG